MKYIVRYSVQGELIVDSKSMDGAEVEADYELGDNDNE